MVELNVKVTVIEPTGGPGVGAAGAGARAVPWGVSGPGMPPPVFGGGVAGVTPGMGVFGPGGGIPGAGMTGGMDMAALVNAQAVNAVAADRIAKMDFNQQVRAAQQGMRPDLFGGGGGGGIPPLRPGSGPLAPQPEQLTPRVNIPALRPGSGPLAPQPEQLTPRVGIPALRPGSGPLAAGANDDRVNPNYAGITMPGIPALKTSYRADLQDVNPNYAGVSMPGIPGLRRGTGPLAQQQDDEDIGFMRFLPKSWQETLQKRVFGGRPRGLGGLMSVAGGGILAGAASRALTSQFDAEFPETMSAGRFGWQMAGNIPILGGYAELARDGLTDKFSRMAVAQLGAVSHTELSGARQTQAVREGMKDHLQAVRMTNITPAAEAAAAAHLQGAVNRDAFAMTSGPAIVGESSGRMGERRYALASAEAGLAGSQEASKKIGQESAAANAAAEKARKEQRDVGESLVRRTIEKDKAEQAVATGASWRSWFTGGWWGVGENASLESRMIQSNQNLDVARGHYDIATRGVTAAEKRVVTTSEHQRDIENDLIEKRKQVQLAKLEMEKGEQLDILHAQNVGIRGGLPQLGALGPTYRQNLLTSARQAQQSGIMSIGYAAIEQLRGNTVTGPWADEALRKEADRDPATAALLAITNPAGRGGGLADREKEERNLEADMMRIRQGLVTQAKQSVKELGDTFIQTFSGLIKDIAEGIENTVRQDLGLQRSQRRREADARAAGGR